MPPPESQPRCVGVSRNEGGRGGSSISLAGCLRSKSGDLYLENFGTALQIFPAELASMFRQELVIKRYRIMIVHEDEMLM